MSAPFLERYLHTQISVYVEVLRNYGLCNIAGIHHILHWISTKKEIDCQNVAM